MNRYWTRIGLGALAVFGVGLLGMTAVRNARARVGSYLATIGGRLPRQIADLGFRLDGQRLGDLTGLQLERSARGDAGTAVLRVELTDPARLADLASCTLVASPKSLFDASQGFHCHDQAAIDRGDFVRWGEVSFTPGGVTRPIYVARSDFERLNQSDIRSLQASVARAPDGAVRAQGRFDLLDRQGPGTRGTFNLATDASGTVVSVKDDAGQALVDLRADQHGVHLNLHDRHGRNLLKLLADSLGAALDIGK
jgi:hypothetical protein